MDLGHYTLSAIRGIFGAEPTSVISATPRLVSEPYDSRCDECMTAEYAFPNGGVGKISADLGARGGYWFPWLTSNWPSFRDSPPWARVTLREGTIQEDDGTTKAVRKTIYLSNFMGPHIGHKIEITTETAWKDATGKSVKTEKNVETKKVYNWPEESRKKVRGEEWWTTYRYMLEEFVNKVKGREGSGRWIDGEESIGQMEATDRTYEKAGMLVRPTSRLIE